MNTFNRAAASGNDLQMWFRDKGYNFAADKIPLSVDGLLE